MPELTLNDALDTTADDGGALVLDHPQESNDAWNDLVKDAVEPFDPHKSLRVLRRGDVLEVVEPCHRRAKVLKCRETSAIVSARVWHGKKLLEWTELWALRTLTYEDPQVPNRTWTEDHCMVIDETRSPAARLSSHIIAKYVRAVRSPYQWDQPPADVTNAPESATTIPAVLGSQYPPPPTATEAMIGEESKPRRVTFWTAQKLAREKGIDISDLTGEGALEKIMERVNASHQPSAT